MKFATLLGLALVAQTVSAHYIFNTLIAGSKTSSKAVRKPLNNSPVHDYTGSEITCNLNPSKAQETVTVNAGDTIGFKVDAALYHKGPVAIYLGKAPGSAANWNGSGKNWFKTRALICCAISPPAAGSTFNPFSFSSQNKDKFKTTIPKSVPSGEYLVRIEQAGLHLTGTPEFFVSCAQIKVVNGGKGNPSKVSIPGYIPKNDPSVMVNIYDPVPTAYTCPGPSVYRGSAGLYSSIFSDNAQYWSGLDSLY
ncbi:glycoside hydrolase family 61 protein [Crucibulum laeve]|uniref:AA9 family lytic polysaccharide monooxygenase n=1 Tax=Crucibulum laeve TaxID=68775 RepID=A0A5C3LPF7_9AGAR|nr:glycoside hydrolase family 61 protein [Crucibulum laeve]